MQNFAFIFFCCCCLLRFIHNQILTSFVFWFFRMFYSNFSNTIVNVFSQYIQRNICVCVCVFRRIICYIYLDKYTHIFIYIGVSILIKWTWLDYSSFPLLCSGFSFCILLSFLSLFFPLIGSLSCLLFCLPVRRRLVGDPTTDLYIISVYIHI